MKRLLIGLCIAEIMIGISLKKTEATIIIRDNPTLTNNLTLTPLDDSYLGGRGKDYSLSLGLLLPSEEPLPSSEELLVVNLKFEVVGIIIIGELEYYRWLDEGYYKWIERIFSGDIYYEILDSGVCYWWLNGRHFLNGISGVYLDRPPYYKPFSEVFPSGYRQGIIMREPDYYSWIDQGYYRALERGIWYFREQNPFIIPEPSSIMLFNLGFLFLFLSTKKRKIFYH